MEAKQIQIVKHAEHYELWLVNEDDTEDAFIALSPEAMNAFAQALGAAESKPFGWIGSYHFDLEDQE